MVRFNPFEDTGGNQSFALAILDAQGNGFVVSSLHSRGGTRVYGKTVAGGKAETALSHEEAEALRLALASGAGPAGGRDGDARRDTQAGTGARHPRVVAPTRPTPTATEDPVENAFDELLRMSRRAARGEPSAARPDPRLGPATRRSRPLRPTSRRASTRSSPA